MEEQKKKTFTFWGFLKTLFLILIILQILPMFFSNIKKSIEEAISPKTKIGHLTINGFIGDSNFFVKKIRSFTKNSDIKGLFIKINSPGGVPGSAQAIFSELKKCKENKPIVILVENVCASAAYYIAVAGNTIISQPSSLVGSIGGFVQLPNIKGLIEDWKIKFNFVQSGKYKTAGNPFQDLTPEEKEYFQTISDNIYEQFINDVSICRNINKTTYKKWSDGKVFTGTQALELKLIDKIGSLSEAIDEIKKLAGIKEDEEIKLIKAKPSSGLLKYLHGQEDEKEENGGFSTLLVNFFSNIFDKVIEKQKIKSEMIQVE